MQSNISQRNGLPVFIALDEIPAELPTPCYIIDKSGWNLHYQNSLYRAMVPANEASKDTQQLLFTGNRIPQKLMQQVAGFFAQVYKRSKSEALGYLLYNGVDWKFHVPQQTATSAHCKLQQPIPNQGEYKVAGSIHSHGSMSAFHSSTDVKDEAQFDGIHITIGNVDRTPELVISLVAHGVRFSCTPELVLEQDPEVVVPQEWLDRVAEEKPVSRYSQWEDEKEEELVRHFHQDSLLKRAKDTLLTGNPANWSSDWLRNNKSTSKQHKQGRKNDKRNFFDEKRFRKQ